MQTRITQFFHSCFEQMTEDSLPESSVESLFQQYTKVFNDLQTPAFSRRGMPPQQIPPAWDYILENHKDLCDTKILTDYLATENKNIFTHAVNYYYAFHRYSELEQAKVYPFIVFSYNQLSFIRMFRILI